MTEAAQVVERADEIDRKIVAVAETRHRLLAVALAVIVALSLATTILLLRLSVDNHRVLTAQIPALRSAIKDRDQTISDQRTELDQALAAIVKLAHQVVMLGGDPGQIVIKPPKHPATP